MLWWSSSLPDATVWPQGHLLLLLHDLENLHMIFWKQPFAQEMVLDDCPTYWTSLDFGYSFFLKVFFRLNFFAVDFLTCGCWSPLRWCWSGGLLWRLHLDRKKFREQLNTYWPKDTMATTDNSAWGSTIHYCSPVVTFGGYNYADESKAIIAMVVTGGTRYQINLSSFERSEDWRMKRRSVCSTAQEEEEEEDEGKEH